MKLYDTLMLRSHTGVALSDSKESVTYPQLAERIRHLSSTLRCAAGGRHFRVLVCEKPSVASCTAMLAIIEAGGAIFMYQPQAGSVEAVARAHEIDLILGASAEEAPSSLLCSSQTLKEAAGRLYPDRTYVQELTGICAGFFTSGTSGEPKCVLLTQENLASDVKAGCAMLEYTPEDVHLLLLPLYHAYGFTCSLLAVLYGGGQLWIGGGSARLPEDLAHYQPTFLQVVPMIAQLLLKLEKIHPTRLKKVLCGGAKTPVTMIEAFRQQKIDLYSCYGLTEAAPCVACNDLTPGKEHTSGRLLSCNDIMFRDGEILLRGTNIMYGYYGMKPHTGWYATGDCGHLDQDGFLCITGRKDFMLKTAGGEKVHPELIEEAVLAHCGAEECLVSLQQDRVIAEIYGSAILSSRKEILRRLAEHLPAGYHVDDVIMRNEPFPKTKLMKIIRRPQHDR